MKDGFGREIEYMRVSITDRCDLRCKYCMPDGCERVPMDRILKYEEIARIVEAASTLGIKRIKVTGGEPFVRPGCTTLLKMLKDIKGIEEVTVTTNGQQLEGYIDELKAIGIDGINISLDTLDTEKYRELTGRGDLDKTLKSIEAALASGIRTKINCLPQRGLNDEELCDLVSFACERGLDMRFIETMPIGAASTDKGMPGTEVLKVLKEKWPGIEADPKRHGNGPAVYYKIPGMSGSVGLISPLSGRFCGSCNRIRLTSQGSLVPCLAYDSGTDLKPYLAKSDDELRAAIAETIVNKPAGHDFERRKNDDDPASRRLMSELGG